MNEERSSDHWDKAAATFDDEPDHGLLESATREAWTALLRKWLPAHSDVLDIGCGTGSLSVVMATLGHTVTAIDFSPAMIAQARAKADAAGCRILFEVMDAAHPHFEQRFDVVLCRHVLWALPEPAKVLQRWAGLLKPGGRLILIEGFWHTGGGLHVDDVLKALPAACAKAHVELLSESAVLWGKIVDDERFAVIAEVLPLG